jgi:hypothetical protein
MKPTFAILAVAALVLGACSGGAAPTAAPGGPTAAPGQPTPPPAQLTAPPAQGGTTVSVVITGGEHPGTYVGSDNPNCSFGFFAPDAWGTQYSVFEGIGPGQLSSVQLVYRPSGGGGEDEMFPGVTLKVTVGIGPIFDTANGYTEYDIEVHTDPADSSGTGTAQVSDAGATAVIHATGTTEDGVGLDVTVNCPAVIRG